MFKLHLHHRLADGEGAELCFGLSYDDWIERLAVFVLVARAGKHVGCRGNFRRLVAAVLFQAALVAAHLFFDFLSEAVERRVNFTRLVGCFRGQSPAQLHDGVAFEVMRVAGKGHLSVDHLVGVFRHGG